MDNNRKFTHIMEFLNEAYDDIFKKGDNMNRGSCVRCEEQEAILRDPHGDEVCVTCYNINVKAIKEGE